MSQRPIDSDYGLSSQQSKNVCEVLRDKFSYNARWHMLRSSSFAAHGLRFSRHARSKREVASVISVNSNPITNHTHPTLHPIRHSIATD